MRGLIARYQTPGYALSPRTVGRLGLERKELANKSLLFGGTVETMFGGTVHGHLLRVYSRAAVTAAPHATYRSKPLMRPKFADELL